VIGRDAAEVVDLAVGVVGLVEVVEVAMAIEMETAVEVEGVVVGAVAAVAVVTGMEEKNPGRQ